MNLATVNTAHLMRAGHTRAEERRTPRTHSPCSWWPTFISSGHEQDTSTEQETAQASELLRRYSEAEVRSLINYADNRLKDTHFYQTFFGAVLTHQPAWSAHLTERQEAAAGQAAKRPFEK